MPSNLPVALVTGAARRVGAALSRALHNRSYNLIIHCNQSITEAQQLAAELNSLRPDSAKVLQANLDNITDINRLATAALAFNGRIDVLINNASSFFPTPLGTATEHHWNNLFNSNVKAPFFLSQALAPKLAQNKGCIINISDIFAERPMPNHAVYSIAKAANNMLTQSLALELAPKVRVNAIAPGAVLWPEDSERNEVVNLGKLAQIPLGRLGGAEAVVNAALYLIEQAPYVTGQILRVDGGRSLQQ